MLERMVCERRKVDEKEETVKATHSQVRLASERPHQ